MKAAPLPEAPPGFELGEDPDRIVNAMTIDVEDYFHVSVFDGLVPRHRWEQMESRVVANTERLLELFSESRLRATFFVLGWVAERHPRLVRSIAAAGHEIASHGYAHRLVYDLTPRQFRDDIRRSKDLLEAEASCPVVGYRAPSYSITPRSLWALDVLIEEGFLYDSSIFPIHHDRYGIPISPRHPYVLQRAGALVEAPGSTVRWGTMNLPVETTWPAPFRALYSTSLARPSARAGRLSSTDGSGVTSPRRGSAEIMRNVPSCCN